MIQLHFDVNQLNIGKSMGVLHLFAWNYVNYANNISEQDKEKIKVVFSKRANFQFYV